LFLKKKSTSGARKSSEAIKPRYETLLEDKSYITNEIALIKLWSTFSADRHVYLDRTKHIIGLAISELCKTLVG